MHNLLITWRGLNGSNVHEERFSFCLLLTVNSSEDFAKFQTHHTADDKILIAFGQ